MTTPAPSADELWALARRDAGPEVADVALIRVKPLRNPYSQGRFMPPGERHVDLAPDDLEEVNAAASRPRVVLPVDQLASDPPVLLALMRHHLEYARVLRLARGSYSLALSIAASLYPAYQRAGRGSAVIYNAVPMMRSANAVAERLVARHYGPQYDRPPDSPFAGLFRTEHAPIAPGLLARPLTVFSAIWPDAFEAELEGHGLERDKMLSRANDEAPKWWSLVREDDTFAALALAAAAFRPTPAEIEAFRDTPALAWRAAEALIDRASRFGLALLERAPLRQG